ncbi:uncharacterized protein DS421_3g80120 [Arachis hypogaea]|nr:uncharacterized protein DS421_3g80120 [Arachis hypogaea]
MTVHFTWFHERFQVLPADATEDTVRIYARAYIMMLLSTQLIRDKSANLVHIRWLPFVANLDDMGSCYRVGYSGGFLCLGPSGFEVFLFPLASRWDAYLPPNDGKE